MDKTAIVIILIIVVLAVGFFVWQYKPIPQTPVTPTPLPEGIVFFYGDTCTHCKDVEDYITANQIEQKIKYTSLEAFNNQANAQLLINIGTSCGLDQENIGAVPLVYDGSKCYLGAPDSINFFKNAAGIQ